MTKLAGTRAIRIGAGALFLAAGLRLTRGADPAVHRPGVRRSQFRRSDEGPDIHDERIVPPV